MSTRSPKERNKLEAVDKLIEEITLDVRRKGETLWLNLTQMAGLFERDKSVTLGLRLQPLRNAETLG